MVEEEPSFVVYNEAYEVHCARNGKEADYSALTSALTEKYGVAFDYSYKFAKNIRPHTIKFSIIKNL
jgi:hypothetical protein